MEVAGNAVGLDLGKRTYEMCLIAPNGKAARTGGKTDFAGIDNLCRKLKKDDVIAMEACNLAFRIERTIREKVGCRVVILNPGRLAIIFMSTRKTDKEDSMKLAKYIKSHEEDEMPVVAPPSDEEWARRKLLSEYRSLKSQRTREINRLHAIFEHAGFTQFTRKDMCVPKNREEILSLLKGYEKEEAGRLAERLLLLEKQIELLYEKINDETEKDEKVQRLMTVPGIGPITALSYVAYIGDVKRFENAHQVSNFIGFVPKVDCSCTINRLGHITKQGNSLLRSLLVQAAWSCVRSKNGAALREKYNYMSAVRGIGKGKSIVTIARKLGELLYTLLKNNKTYEPKKFISSAERLSKMTEEALGA
ncbi:MAG: IS110 family transposase [Treponema sp.]|nr:IS110 family transposase [Treponema sp.]